MAASGATSAFRQLILLCVASILLAGAPQEAYDRGLELAKLGRWEDARTVLISGLRFHPRDPRLLVELGGVAFKLKRNAEAARWLRRSLNLNPSDSYSTEFLGTLHFLDGNPEAALRYWNRIGKPKLAELHIEPGLRIDPVLLDRAFSISQGDVLTIEKWLTTQARIRSLGVFPVATLRMEALDDGRFDVRMTAEERNGLGNSKWQAAASALRGIGFQSVILDATNLKGSAINWSTLLRWDPQKRRVRTSLSAPLGMDARRRVTFEVDGRDEQWELLSGGGRSGPGERFGFRRLGVEVGVAFVRQGGWNWSLSSEFSHRDSRGLAGGRPEGFQLKQTVRAERALIYRPEHRFESSLALSSGTGRVWSTPSKGFERLEATLSTTWSPGWKGDDYRLRQVFGGGGIVGQAPLDELFQLGLERDNDLQMRGHVGTRYGRKGSAPLGSRYLISNSEFDKKLYSNGIFQLNLSPFLDSGKIGSPLSVGWNKWLWDTGAQLKVEAAGIGFALVYGKDLRTGSNAFYVMAIRSTR
jgi:hypothetical protein